jgi:hypothetical protein
MEHQENIEVLAVESARRIKLRSKICGHEWWSSMHAAEHYRSTGCFPCTRREPGGGRPAMTEAQARARLDGIEDLTMVTYGGKWRARSLFHCNAEKDHPDWWADCDKILQGGGCPYCAVSARLAGGR